MIVNADEMTSFRSIFFKLVPPITQPRKGRETKKFEKTTNLENFLMA